MKLVKLNNEYYLLKEDMSKMAKDLPNGTTVFCLSETHINDIDECIRKYSEGDHCYGCQPLIASSKKMDEVKLLDKIQINELVGNVDVENLARELTYKDYTDKDGEFIRSTIGASDYTAGIVRGYNYALQKNTNSFSLMRIKALMLEVWKINNLELSALKKEGIKTVNDIFDKLIEAATKKQTEWEVEVEMICSCGLSGNTMYDHKMGCEVKDGSDLKPKISENGNINITKIK